ncbi:MAG: ferritin-like domain-containing protein [Pseudomonadota bacterium]
MTAHNSAARSISEPSDVNDILQTPLSTAYLWNYDQQEDRIKRLYTQAKEQMWNVDADINWDDAPFDHAEALLDPEITGFANYEGYLALSENGKRDFLRHYVAWQLSQFLHGEQGALLVASQLVSCAPTMNAKLYASAQTFDEARHVEAFSKYINTKIGLMYPVNASLKRLLDKILTDERWDLKFIGMQIIIEAIALASFANMREGVRDPLLKDILRNILRDESRHISFGVNFLADFVRNLPDHERRERAEFAYESCVVIRERLIPFPIFEHFGWDRGDAHAFVQSGEIVKRFQELLFRKIMPNLARVGLLMPETEERFERLGVLGYVEEDPDFEHYYAW